MSGTNTPRWTVPADFIREFHVSRAARDTYQFEDLLFSLRGTVVIPNFRAARQFADQMNDRRDLVRYPEQAVKAGQINAMALIHEILHLMIVTYRQQTNPGALQDALEHLDETLDTTPVQTTLTEFVDDFPAKPVYKGEVTVPEFLASDTAGDPNSQVALEEMLLLWLSNTNPAFEPYRELFDDTPLERDTAYEQMIREMRQFFAGQPGFGEGNVSLIDMLEAPAKASPYSLEGQLEFIRQKWPAYLGKNVFRLLAGLDLIAEEEKPIFLGPGPSEAPDFAHMTVEPERFSPDLDWMPKVVMMAKNAYVWLDQLSRQVRRGSALPEPDTGRGTGFPGRGRLHRPVADRPVGAQHRVAHHQADDGQPRGGGVGLLAVRLRDRGRSGRLAGLQGPARPGLAARHPPGQRHGTQPHRHRWQVGDRASRLVCPASLQPLPILQLQRAEPEPGRAGRHLSRGPLLRPHRRCGGFPAA